MPHYDLLLLLCCKLSADPGIVCSVKSTLWNTYHCRESAMFLHAMLIVCRVFIKVAMCSVLGDSTNGVHVLCPGSYCRLFRGFPSPLRSDRGRAHTIQWLLQAKSNLVLLQVAMLYALHQRGIVHNLFVLIVQQEAELCSATAQFEDFVLEFLNR